MQRRGTGSREGVTLCVRRAPGNTPGSKPPPASARAPAGLFLCKQGFNSRARSDLQLEGP
jgi:hypothetical protein